MNDLSKKAIDVGWMTMNKRHRPSQRWLWEVEDYRWVLSSMTVARLPRPDVAVENISWPQTWEQLAAIKLMIHFSKSNNSCQSRHSWNGACELSFCPGACWQQLPQVPPPSAGKVRLKCGPAKFAHAATGYNLFINNQWYKPLRVVTNHG